MEHTVEDNVKATVGVGDGAGLSEKEASNKKQKTFLF